MNLGSLLLNLIILKLPPAWRDFIVDESGLADGSVDFVMLFNILHAAERLETGWSVGIPF